MIEKWKPIKDYEDRYLVSNMGLVKSLVSDIIMNPSLVKGYYQLALCAHSKYKFMFVSRLVALHFIPNPLNKPQVNHKNGIKTDNRAVNLEWCTPAENVKHSYDTGLVNRQGVLNPKCKLSESDVLNIRILGNRMNYKQIAKNYDVCIGTVSLIVNRKTWKHLKKV